MKIAYFISGHGLGHATRSIALMEAISERYSESSFFVSSSMPEFLRKDIAATELSFESNYIEPGIIQSDQLTIDVERTIHAAEQFISSIDLAIEFYRHQVADCSFIIADISVLGILLGAQLGIPVFLIENFRWDWVYQSQIAIDSRFAKLSKWYSEQYRVANKHFQCEPICDRQSQGIILPPISRCFRHSKTQIKSSLQLDIEDKSSQLPIVLLSLQGQTKESAVAKSLELEGVSQCLATVSGIDSITKEGNCTIIPASSYHPDLVSIADLVVAKLGYSTLGEVYRAKTRLAYLSRKWFPESSVLEEFAQRELVARELTSLENDFTDTIRQLLDIQATKSLTSLDSASMFSPVFDSIDSLHSV